MSSATPLKVLDPTYQKALTAVQAADDRKGGDIVLLDVSQVSTLADYFLFVSGFSLTQIRAISREIQDQMLLEWEEQPQRIEGQSDASWVLLDYADIIIHIMTPEERDFYDLESFWSQAERVILPIAG